MPTLTIEYQDEAERLALEQAIAVYLTAAAGRTACLAGLKQSFAQAQRPLAELAGRDLDDETARRPCQATAARAAAGRDERATAQAFAAAAGDPEVQTDAGKANTLDGRRDV